MCDQEHKSYKTILETDELTLSGKSKVEYILEEFVRRNQQVRINLREQYSRVSRRGNKKGLRKKLYMKCILFHLFRIHKSNYLKKCIHLRTHWWWVQFCVFYEENSNP